MIETLIRGLVPIMLARVGAMSLAEKRYYAAYASELLTTYLANDRARFETLIEELGPLDELKRQAIEALWREN